MELESLRDLLNESEMRRSYLEKEVRSLIFFCLKKKKYHKTHKGSSSSATLRSC